MRLRTLAGGLVSSVPGLERLLIPKRTGGTNSALYCYGVWLKHLTLLWGSGMRAVPEAMAELGPGDSLGVGLAAMLSGTRRYFALDVVAYSNAELNLRLLDELVTLFRARSGRPVRGWPDYDRHLDPSLFPSHILTDRVLAESLAEDRIQSIRHALVRGTEDKDLSVTYVVPWSGTAVMEAASVDVVISHCVLEYVSDLEATYRGVGSLLKGGGLMSHQIDLTSHGITKEWNGHWTVSDRMWSLASGRRPFLLNRHPCSAHIDMITRCGFEVLLDLRRHRADGVERSRLAPRWAGMSDDDLTCAGAFIQARKR